MLCVLGLGICEDAAGFGSGVKGWRWSIRSAHWGAVIAEDSMLGFLRFFTCNRQDVSTMNFEQAVGEKFG